MASIMTSLYPSTHGCVEFSSVLADTHLTLAEILSDQGFVTAAVASHVFVGSRHGIHQGFREYDEELVLKNAADSHRAITSPRITSKGIAWLLANARRDTRWFLWLHYFDPHAVYRVHADLDVDFPTESEADRYDGEIAFTDRAIGELLAGLSQLGLAEDTLVVVVADHGEELEDHGKMGHGETLYREIVDVPLLMRIPGQEHRRISAVVRMVDVMPTILDLLGVVPPDGSVVEYWEGVSLVSAIRGSDTPQLSAIAELRRGRRLWMEGIERGRWKLILDQGSGTIELFDVEDDPQEAENLAGEEPRIVAELERELSRAIASAEHKAKRHGARQHLDLSHEQKENLRRLGYVE
jgi:arylsulfatase A-like enzyme